MLYAVSTLPTPSGLMAQGEPMSSAALADLVIERATRSIYLCQGLIEGLHATHQPGLAKIVGMVQEDAMSARSASKLQMDVLRAESDEEILKDLQRLSFLAGDEGAGVALRIARRVHQVHSIPGDYWGTGSKN